ncbi:MAG: hypothetical protein JW746_09975 [Candidatus Krumholzibacteriota bacterium]|nr:hypothetical protein [Candidatus Krumholzibacteriota bacterium]
MKRFRRVLKEINRKLDLPQQEKSRILLEIGSDLEDMYQLYLAQGYTDQEAIERAEEKFDISDDALEELVRIHQTIFARLLSRLSEQAQSRWEKALMVTILLLIALLSGQHLFSTGFFGRTGSFIWPLAAISIIAGMLTIRHTYMIYLKKDHRTGRLRGGLIWFPALGIGSLMAGIFGSSVETMRMVRAVAADLDTTHLKIVQCAIKGSSMMILSLLVAIASSLIWFILVNKVKQIELAETEWLNEI